MRVKRTHLINFRNHTDTLVQFSSGINLIIGANAQGKTSILEALSYVCLTKDFLQQSDSTVCRVGTNMFSVDAVIEKDIGSVNHVLVTYDSINGKKYILDGNEIRRSTDVIGTFPIVVLSPTDFALTTGSPAERRKFVDMILSQVSHSYLEDLIEYRRALRQRNKVLLDGKITNNTDKNVLDAWTNSLVERGTKVMLKRMEFVRDFREDFANSYKLLVSAESEGVQEFPSLIYKPSVPSETDESDYDGVARVFNATLNGLAKAEIMRGATLAGPHRDDIGFSLNSMPVREFASQGQHKTFLVALKIAEFHYMKSKLGETPMMLLDDVMTELDYSRASRTIRLISSLGQAFITATDMFNVDERLLELKETEIHVVRNGTVAYDVPKRMLRIPAVNVSQA
jgi:DNA replication and repair protein RecF